MLEWCLPLIRLINCLPLFTLPTSQGLGTSTAKEGKEYFRDLDKNRKKFAWETEEDGEAIEMAFSKKKIDARKSWLRNFEVRGGCLIG